MKVTKAIREFIEQQVEIKANQALEPFAKKREAAIQGATEDIGKLQKEVDSMFQIIINKYNIERKPYMRLPNLESYLPEVKEYNEKICEFYNKRRSIVIEIIAEMELGGTKAELIEKINNISF